MAKWPYVLLALGCGVGLALQVGFNSQLRTRFGHPVPAAITNFVVGLACLLALAVASGVAVPSRSLAAEVPWWGWLGGLMGAIYIAATASHAPKLGATGWLAAIIGGQVLGALVLDHYGLVGFSRQPIGPLRLLGAGLLILGVVLVLKR